MVGSGVRAAKAESLLHDFMKKTNIPVLTTMNAVDLVQGEDHLGFIGTYGNRCANILLNESDFIISIGARLGLRQIGKKKEAFAPNAELVRVDIDQYELGRIIKDDEKQYNMDASVFLELLLREDIADYSSWKKRCKELSDLLDGYDDVVGNNCIKEIAKVLPENPVVAVDVGQHECWVAQSLLIRGEEGRILIGGGYGAMGSALPFAIGAAYAQQGTPIFCISGDGGMQMNIQELEVIKRDKLPIKIFIINNETLGKISEIQHKGYGDRFAQTTKDSGYTVPNFEAVATAYGIRAARVTELEKICSYGEWMEDNEACLLNIMVPDANLLIPKLKWETFCDDPPLDEAMSQEVEKVIRD